MMAYCLLPSYQELIYILLCQAGVDPPGAPGGDVEHESWCLAGGGSREAGPGPGDTEDEDSATCQHRIKDLYTTHTED